MIVEYYDSKKSLDIIDTIHSIFLAGPSPRNIEQREKYGWRELAIQEFEKQKFEGRLYIPEFKDYKNTSFQNYSDFPEWELERIDSSDIVLFWVPRVIPDFPAFTTNVEFGYCLSKFPQKVVYGRPDDSPKNKYLDYLYKRQSKKNPFNTLEKTVEHSVNFFM